MDGTQPSRESEHVHNTLCVLPEVRRRRDQRGVVSKAMVTSDNYVTHHNLREVKTELDADDILFVPLRENSTDLV